MSSQGGIHHNGSSAFQWYILFRELIARTIPKSFPYQARVGNEEETGGYRSGFYSPVFDRI